MTQWSQMSLMSCHRLNQILGRLTTMLSSRTTSDRDMEMSRPVDGCANVLVGHTEHSSCSCVMHRGSAPAASLDFLREPDQ